MFWPWLSLALLGALCWLHFWWRARCRHECQQVQFALTRAEEDHVAQLSTLRAQQETLFDSMTDGLLLLDKDGRIQVANRCFISLFGITGDITSKSVIEVLRLHEVAALVAAVRSGSTAASAEIKPTGPAERWLDINATAILDSHGERQGTMLVFHDLSRLRLLENTRKDFVANVSHELRTPLALIKGYVETLLDGAKDNPELCTRFLNTIERNSERLRLLIEDLLVISELESGKLLVSMQPTALQVLVRKVVEDLQPRADERKMRLVNACPDVCVYADAGRLEQVLTNLLDNALKYGKEAGVVQIDARPAADPAFVQVMVQDDGPGLAADDLERVFERFYRVDRARSREQGGTGLGLSIVKHIVQSHGGKAWAESTPGQGATFCFTLRAVAAPARGVSSEAQALCPSTTD